MRIKPGTTTLIEAEPKSTVGIWFRVMSTVLLVLLVGKLIAFRWPSVDLAILDSFFALSRSWYTNQGPSGDIFIIKITEKTEKRTGYYFNDPRMRRLHAELVRRLNRLKERPKVVAFDLRFEESSAYDPELIKVLLGAGNVVIAYATSPEDLAPSFRTVPAMGFVLTDIDPDGKVRRLTPVRKCLANSPGAPGVFSYLPSFLVEVLAASRRESAKNIIIEKTRELKVGDKKIMLDRQPTLEDCTTERASGLPGTMLINFSLERPIAFEYGDVLFGSQGRIDNEHTIEMLSGSIVLVGVTHPEGRDVYEVPFGGLAGIEILGAGLETILQDRYISQPGDSAIWVLSTALSFFMTTWFLIKRVRRKFFWSCMLIPLGGSLLAFMFAHVWIGVSSMLFSALLVPAARLLRLLPRGVVHPPSGMAYVQSASLGVLLSIYFSGIGPLGGSALARAAILGLLLAFLQLLLKRRKREA